MYKYLRVDFFVKFYCYFVVFLLCPAKSMKIHFIVVYFEIGVFAVFETNCKKNYVIPLSPHNRGRQSPAKIKPNESRI
jgi:hypothetical protein